MHFKLHIEKKRNIFVIFIYCHVLYDSRRGSYCRFDLLTTWKHDSCLHLMLAPKLFSTIYKSQQHTLSLSSVLSSLVVAW
jgi:hypothetical protein